MTDALDETLEDARRKRDDLAPGALVGKYRLERVLGSGGMGVVWAAHDPDLERTIALKLLRGAAADADPHARQRLLREARAMAKLAHPNVIVVYEVGTAGDRDFIAMELVDGSSLDVWLADKPARKDAWQAVLAAGRGLAAAHAAGLVHRDFKPHNVLRARDGRIVVTDFGLAREEGSALSIDTSAPVGSGGLTNTGALVGTPAYMAPEQFAGASPEPRTDQFAFCVTAWQVLCGARPFSGATIDELCRAANAGPPSVAPNLSRAVRDVLTRGLAPAARDRWPSVEALLAALERAADAPMRRKRTLAWVARVVGAIGAITLVFGLTQMSRDHAVEVCEPPSFDAWTPAQRAGIDQHVDPYVLDALDHYRDAWHAAYAHACTTHDAMLAARRSCLERERDRAVAVVRFVEHAPPDTLARADIHFLLPSLSGCTGAQPFAVPALPAELSARDRELAGLERLLALRFAAPETVAPAARALEQSMTSWERSYVLVAGARFVTGLAARRLQHWDDARAAWLEAQNAAVRGGDEQLALETCLALLELDTVSAPDPTAPKAVFENELEAVDARIRGDGYDRLFYARGAQIEAQARMAQDDYVAWTQAIAEAEQLADGTGDLRLEAKAFSDAIESLAFSAEDGPLDFSRMFAIQADDLAAKLEHARLPTTPLDRALASVAWVRRDLVAVHSRFDRMPRHAADGELVHGVVRGSDGKPAAGALVVAWRGELDGDSTRLYSDGNSFDGDIATSADDGAFAIHAPAGGALVAELGDLRAIPVLAREGATLQLATTHEITGRAISERALGFRLDAYARVWAGDNVLLVRTNAGDTFSIARVPAGAELGLIERHPWIHFRAAIDNLAKVAWPRHFRLDVIVHGMSATIAWTFPAGVVPKTRGEAQALAWSAPFASWSDVHPIGADATDPGRTEYRRGDVHAVLDVRSGAVTACIASGADASTPVTCEPVSPAKADRAVVIAPHS